MEVLSLAAIGRRLGVTKEAVRQWILKFESYSSSRPLFRREERSAILLDETKVKRNGKIACVSAHLTRKEIVSAKSYRSASIVNHRHHEDGPGVVQEEAAVHSRPRPMVRMRLRWLDVDRVPLTFSIRNYIERWYRTFKEGTKRFHHNFGVREGIKAIKRVERFVHLFAFWYKSHEAS